MPTSQLFFFVQRGRPSSFIYSFKAGEYMPDTELRQMIAEANISGTSKVTVDEFVRIMLRTNIYR